MRLRTWSGSIVDTRRYYASELPFVVARWAEGWVRYGIRRAAGWLL